MKGKIKLDIKKGRLRKNGFPVIIELFHKKQVRFNLGLYFFEHEWDFEKEEPINDKRSILLIRKKKSLLDDLIFSSLTDNSISTDYIKAVLLDEAPIEKGEHDFFLFAKTLMDEMIKMKDAKGFDKYGNANVYRTATNQLKLFREKLLFKEIDYNFLLGFKNWQINKNSKPTANTYLRTLRAIYNEGARRGLVNDIKPFKDIFKGITQKQNRTKKRHINSNSIFVLENMIGLPEGQQIAVDLWLLQFYLGGQDFKDIYYLENYQIVKSRVFFNSGRSKLDGNGYQFDLKLFDKAQSIINKYQVDGRFCFPWRKDFKGYKAFIRRVQENLKKVQSKYNDHVLRISNQNKVKYHLIEVLPLGGNLSPKVSRHTFGTLGSRLFVEPDLLRALMGHERDDVDTIYKDVYPENIRDEWHYRIIETNNVSFDFMYVYEVEYVTKDKSNRVKKFKYANNILSKEQLEYNGSSKYYKLSKEEKIVIIRDDS